MPTFRHLSIISVSIALLLGVVMTSCGSGRHTVSRGNYRNDDIYYASDRNRPQTRPAQSTTTKRGEKASSATIGDIDDMSPVVTEAQKWIGTKYRSGGNSRAGTDCSGLVWAIYGDIMSIKMPRTAWEQQIFCKPVNRSALMPGDLVFFSSGKNGRVSHVGIYIGKGEMIHASTSSGVIRSALNENYYQRHYHSAGRVGNYKGAPTVQPKKIVDSRAALEDLDDTITEMTDSILSSYLD